MISRFFRSINTLFVLFVVGVIVPAGILTFVGFRSFRYEDRLLDRLTQDQYVAIADNVARTWQNELTVFLETVTSLVKDQDLAKQTPETAAAAIGSLHQIRNIPVLGSFIFARDGSLLFPARQDSSDSPAHDSGWGAYSDRMREIESLEFAKASPGAAVKGYRDLLNADLTPSQRRELLKIIAAAERKQGNLDGAVAMLHMLAAEFDLTPDASGLPTGVVSRQLLIRTYEQFSKPDQANEARHDLFHSMVVWHWPVSAETRSRILRETDTDHVDTEMWRNSRILRVEIDREATLARSFQQTSSQQVQQSLRKRGWWDQGGIVASTPSVVVSVPIGEGTGPYAGGRFVAMLDPVYFWSPSAWPIAAQLQGSSATIVALSPVGLLQWGEGSANGTTVERRVTAIEPEITFQLHMPVSGREQSSLRRRRIFAGMMSLSGIVIVAGLALMLRSIRKERENAALKAEFVANISHELKTPLSTILYIGERLSAGRYEPGDTDRFYELLNREASRLRLLIDDVLDFSRMMSGSQAFRTKRIDLREIVQEAMVRTAEPARAGGFEVTLDLAETPQPVDLDDKATVQAVVNLIDNAMKYSGESKQIKLIVRREENDAVLSVQDFGIGIAAEDQEKIFQRFVRIEPALAREHAGGVGLGLAMVKAIVEGQGGRVQVQSELGRGSIFAMRFVVKMEFS